MRPERHAGWLAGGVLAAAALVPPAWIASGPPLCPFRLVTGLPCPGCGLTRSVVSLLHGDPTAALTFHPLGPVVAVGLAALVLAPFAVRLLSPLDAGEPRVGFRGAPAGRARLIRAAPWALLSLFLLVWLVRLPLYVQGLWVY